MLATTHFDLFINPAFGVPGMVVLPEAGFRRAQAEISSWPGYAVTPLHDLGGLAADYGIGCLRLKDEASRFGLGSFKSLGGAYAVGVAVADALARAGVAANATMAELEAGHWRDATRAITVTCATDGNHGRSVAWGAQRFGARCVIFVHAGVTQARIEAMQAYGAEVCVVAGNYDASVREAASIAAASGWLVISDTSWDGYTETPRQVMQGYRVLMAEALAHWDGAPPSHVFIQGGVGGVAAAVSVHLRAHCRPTPRLVVVEPEAAACLLAIARVGHPVLVPGELDTLMAGLACGEPSKLAWAELGRAGFAFMAIPDAAAVSAMRTLAGLGIVIGESGVAGLAGLALVAADPTARRDLGLTPDSRVLVVGTEGATDPALYARLVA